MSPAILGRLLLALLLIGAGIRALNRLPIDAFPDVTNIQVTIIIEITPGCRSIDGCDTCIDIEKDSVIIFKYLSK